MLQIILTIIGARPQFIKAAVVSKQFSQASNVKELMLHTGQHYDENMSDIFFKELEMSPPDFQLAIGSSSHGAQTGRMLEAIEEVLQKVKPSGVLIYGDTNSTLAGALAASKLHIPVFHVEAGLRSFNMKMPEEINRIVSDKLSTLLFAPTQEAVKNLDREGVERQKIHYVGDVMYDIALYYGNKAEQNSDILNKLDVQTGNYILTTIHRAENTDVPIRMLTIIEALLEVAKQIPVVFPIHPRTKHKLAELALLDKVKESLILTEPLGFLDMLKLEKHAKMIVTDSGGVQKEAFFQRVPCVTLRDETEWVELVAMGWNQLVPPASKEAIVQAVLQQQKTKRDEVTEPYGQGDSAKKIVTAIEKAITA